MKRITINGNMSAKIIAGVKELQNELSFILTDNGFPVNTEQTNEKGYRIVQTEKNVTIYYHDSSDFYYSFTDAVIHLGEKRVKSGVCCLDKFGFMPDCSRNAVLTVNAVKQLIRELVKLGYNYLTLYTEDNLEIESEPYYGYLRGRYTKKEIAEIINYAEIFDMEVIPHIQTLGHLETLLRNPTYFDVRDTERVLLAESEKTYSLLDNVIGEIAKMFKSGKIHIGMDEVFMLGAGKYRDKYGYKDEKSIYLNHLIKVTKICIKHGFNQIFCYSECLYKMASNETSHYAENAIFDKAFLEQIPKELTLVYWDYYAENSDRYEKIIKKHLEFGRETVYAAGAWKWISFAPANEHTEHKTVPAMQAVKNTNLKDMYVTAWGDDGGETSVFAVLPSMLLFSELAYGKTKKDSDYDEKSKLLWGYSGKEFYSLDDADKVKQQTKFNGYYGSSSKIAFYEDILLGIMYDYLPENSSHDFLIARDKLEALSKRNSRYSYLFDTLFKLCDFNALKCKVEREVYSAYILKNRSKMKKVIPSLSLCLEKGRIFYEAFLSQWRKENKSIGFEVQNIRIGGVFLSLEYASRVLSAWCENSIDRIEELECPRLTYDPTNSDKYDAFYRWKDIVSKNYFDHH